MENFESHLDTFLKAMQAMVVDYYKRMQYTMEPGTLTPINMKRYVKVAMVEKVSRSAWCFVDKETGDILKAASWAAPAKHARGNIGDPGSWVGFTPYGPQYIRGR